jgi:hypothetical protein
MHGEFAFARCHHLGVLVDGRRKRSRRFRAVALAYATHRRAWLVISVSAAAAGLTLFIIASLVEVAR